MTGPSLYFDHNATAPLAPGVWDAMQPYLEQRFHNPSSASETARPIREALGAARRQVAQLMGAAKPTQIRFTSGGTESIHAAFFSACHAVAGDSGKNSGSRPARILHGGAEHSATKGAGLQWGQAGFEVTTLPVKRAGQLDLDDLRRELEQGDVVLVSLLLANNETGAIQDLAGIAECVHAAGARWHLDAVQGPGKMPLDVAAWKVDWASISGHKFGAPKGVGALYSAHPDRDPAWLRGGGQEYDLRGGTENVAGIVGLGCAAEGADSLAQQPSEMQRIAALRDRLETALCERIEGAYVHGQSAQRVPNTTFVCLPGQPAEFLLPLVEQSGLLCSAGSACDASHWAPSPVLLATGVSEQDASASLRLSLGPSTQPADVDQAIEILVQAVQWLAPGGPS